MTQETPVDSESPTMRAVVIERTGGPEVLAVREASIPDPGPGEVRIRVEAAGVNFADVMTRAGRYLGQPDLPFVPGVETAGTVDAVGECVAHLREGDRVCATHSGGGYAEYAIAREGAVIALGERLDLATAAGLPVAGMTAYHLSHTVAPPPDGGTAVVYAAAGGVGSLLCQLLRRSGSRVIGLVGDDEKAAFARGLGADDTVVYSRESISERVLEMTGGRGADVIYNCVGERTLEGDLAGVATFGTIVMYGQAAGPPSPKGLYVALMRAFMKSPALRLYHLFSSMTAAHAEHEAGAERMIVWLASGEIHLPIHRVYALDEVALAHADIEARRTRGKLLIAP
ncbi:MAG: quinone oxidoreductase [Deltaproteobacteria bacterium]|nr:quinone oxidoreductase [Deltaproteobacteria bacterium]